ncbi:antibiotic biosynthesis monooxygenase family protein [Magnetofaba australis]|uniref:Putative antibiotic biosynthesis monooxygenase n=1 Tax=Magnetofaba australis IT-1 TaxID=1434232 RepID=A0A1Y2K3C7_9PROT|nr:antibiotic biosynthesis monooxygenase [Magnetofaba australis]OSM02521.1 putative antibiotic biosynthesis monooxygenase [Magnetofaba australis IT-1]
MVVVTNRIPVHKEHWEEFEARFKDRAGLVDGCAGFIRNLVLRPEGDSTDYHVVMTFWEDEASFVAWTKSDAFVQAHKKARETPREFYKGSNVFEMFSVISDSADNSA